MSARTFTIGDNYSGTSASSRDGWELDEFTRRLADGGYVVTERNGLDRPWNHRIIGTGVGHDDARWMETRCTEGSMAAYYENGGTGSRAPWWDTTGFSTEGVRYYGCRPRTGRNDLGHSFARHSYLIERAASHTECPYAHCDKR